MIRRTLGPVAARRDRQLFGGQVARPGDRQTATVGAQGPSCVLMNEVGPETGREKGKEDPRRIEENSSSSHNQSSLARLRTASRRRASSKGALISGFLMLARHISTLLSYLIPFFTFLLDGFTQLG